MITLLVTTLALAGPPILPPLPGEAVMPPPAEPDPKPEPKPEPEPEPETPRSTPKPKPRSTPKSKPTSPSPSPSPSPTKPKPNPNPNNAKPLQMATPEELAALQTPAKPKKRKGAKPKRASKPGDRPTQTPDPTVRRTASEARTDAPLTFRRRPRPPKRSAAFVFGYRHFAIHDELDRRQSWHIASVEVTPLRRWVRLNFISEFGVEGGEAARAGDRADFMLLQKVGLGAQYPHFVTPFIEFQGGVGAARVELFERNDLVLTYTLGLDAGIQWAATRWLYLHAALGWIRPVFRRPERTVRFDRLAFKVGLGF